MNPRNINRHQSLAGRVNEREERPEKRADRSGRREEERARPETVSPPS